MLLIISIWWTLLIETVIGNSQLTIAVDENIPVGRKIISLKEKIIVDNEDINKANLSFQPIKSNYFRLTNNGDIFVNSKLDRDTDSALCSDTGFTDVCSSTHVVWVSNIDVITVRIVINDLNDNKPYWADKNPIIPVAENSPINTEIDIPLAIDKDTITNGISKYRLIRSDIEEFELKTYQTSNGIIPRLVIRKLLDREVRDSYNLTIEAIDGSVPFHTGSVVLTIKIADQNDHHPVFDKDIYRVKIKENYPLKNDLPIHPKAVDRDSGDFGKVNYMFSIATGDSVKKTFQIDANTGRISVVGNIDYDNGQHLYEFIIIAADFGSPSLSATAKIVVEVEDVNDQSPEIKVNYLGDDETLTIEENHPPNQLITTVAISDTDTGVGGASNCSLGLANSFLLQFYKPLEHIKVYQLISIRVFDRETEPVIHTQVICQDHGVPMRTSRKLITVTIKDVNDCVPRFNKRFYKFSINEENPIDAEIGKVLAQDNDIGKNGEIEYSIIQSSDKIQELIYVNDNGILLALQSLDREIYNNGFKFKIMAKDKGEPSLNDTANVEVELIDINDCIPKFMKSQYKYAVMENDGPMRANIPHTLGKVEATDCDIQDNARRTFQLKESSNLFEVTEDGLFRIIGVLNREVQPYYNIEVLVIDSLPSKLNRNTATTTIGLTVSDYNDNAPVFINSINISVPIQVSYREDIDTEIYKIYATDADTGINAIIDYSLKPSGLDHLSINSKSGSITVTKQLSSDNMGSHVLIVVATDNGQPKQSTEMTLNLLIDDSVPRSYLGSGTMGNGNSLLRSGFLINNNRLIIILVVSGTVLLSVLLISVFCAMSYCRYPGGSGNTSGGHLSAGTNGFYSRGGHHHDGSKTAELTHSCLSQFDSSKYPTSDINESLLPPSSFYLVNGHPPAYSQINSENFDRYNAISPYGKPTPSESMEEFGFDAVMSGGNTALISPQHFNYTTAGMSSIGVSTNPVGLDSYNSLNYNSCYTHNSPMASQYKRSIGSLGRNPSQLATTLWSNQTTINNNTMYSNNTSNI